MTILPQYMTTQKPEPTLRIQGVEPPTAAQRLLQVAKVAAAGQALAILLAAGMAIGSESLGLEPAEIAEKHPQVYLAAGIGIPLLALVGAIALVARGVYLAQIVGAIGGLATVGILLLERQLVGLDPTMLEWLMLPGLGGVLGFATGLGFAGQLDLTPTVEFRPYDSWDRQTQPSIRELAPPGTARWKRLFAGFLVGLVGGYLLNYVLVLILRPAYGYNSTSVQAVLTNIQWVLDAFVYLLAGMVAGAGTKNGASQGLLAGLAVFGCCYWWQPMDSADALLGAALAIVPATLGGIAGRNIFRPTQVYGSARLDPKHG